MNGGRIGRSCATRALKNAKFLQASHIMPAEEPPGGYSSVVPLPLLERLHELGAADLENYKDLQDFIKGRRVPAPSNAVIGSLFSGTLFFVRVVFITNTANGPGTPVSVSDADVATAIQYATLAAPAISGYASQYGSNTITVSQTVLEFTAKLPLTTYTDLALQLWVDTIVLTNRLDPRSSAVVVLNPNGVINANCISSMGQLGYHQHAVVPYCFANVTGEFFNVQDFQDLYANQLSHEIAEMTVDPKADFSNPEVCDACGPNCPPAWRDFFNDNYIYLKTSSDFPPGFLYNFFINAIAKPGWVGQCPANELACKYPPPGFGNLIDSKHHIWFGDFSGVGRTQVMFYYSGDGHWWLGDLVGGLLNWRLVSQTAGFGNLLDGQHPIWIGDFTGAGHLQVLFYYAGDGNWWLGEMTNNGLSWSLVSQSAGFGNLLDGAHVIEMGNFGSGHMQVLFHYIGDGAWWLGTMSAGTLSWSPVGRHGFGNLLDGHHRIWIGDFAGEGWSQILFYSSSDGNWWLGTVSAGSLTWTLVSQSSGFGNLIDGRHAIWIADFLGNGRMSVMFYYATDGHWWLGTQSGGTLNWGLVSQSIGFGNLLDANHAIHIGKFTGPERAQVMFYYSGDGNWWLGDMGSGTLEWGLASHSGGFGNLLDGSHPIWINDFVGAGFDQVMFYYRGDGNWWLGAMAGGTPIAWSRVSQSGGFGNLIDNQHAIWFGRFTGAPREQILFYHLTDGQWWLGDTPGSTLDWALVGGTGS
jgi:hypothetical protein